MYFDLAADEWMIRPSHRSARSQFIEDAIRMAEEEIVRHYTDLRHESDLDYETTVGDVTHYTHLRTYDPNADAATVAPAFRTAMKHAIAEAAVWILEQWNELEPLTRDEAGKAKTRTFRPEAHDPLPPRVTRWLAPFDLRAPCYTI